MNLGTEVVMTALQYWVAAGCWMLCGAWLGWELRASTHAARSTPRAPRRPQAITTLTANAAVAWYSTTVADSGEPVRRKVPAGK